MSEYPFGRATDSFRLGPAGPPPPGPPLLAYGANAAPAVLARKLPGTRVHAHAGSLCGFAVVHSAHLSPYGAVPATLLAAPGAVVAVHALLLADRAALDATEPNYRRVLLRGLDLDVPGLGGPVTEAEAYLSRHGPLLVDGAPVPLGARPQAELRALVAVRARA